MSYPYAQAGYMGGGYAPPGGGYPPAGGGYPPHGYPSHVYAAPPKPGGGSAITAGVLGLLQGLAVTSFAVWAAIMTREARAEGYESTGSLVAVGIFSTVGLLLVLGATLLFCRRKAGRYLLMMLATLSMLIVAFMFTMTAITADELSDSDVVGFGVGLGILVVIELPMLVCTAMSSTGRWIAARTDTYAPMPGAYAQPPYYGYY